MIALIFIFNLICHESSTKSFLPAIPPPWTYCLPLSLHILQLFWNRWLVPTVFCLSLGFSLYKIISTANCNKFTSSFPMWVPFSSLSCLTALTRTSDFILNKSPECGHPCVVPREKDFNFSPSSIMLAVSFSYMIFIIWKCSQSVEDFYHKRMLYLCRIFFCIYWYNRVISPPYC